MDEKIRRAFELAYFILGDEHAALRVTREAVSTLDVALAAQDKRFYYEPGSRAAPARQAQKQAAGRFRTKVSLSELQLLQRLVYVFAEPEERRKEADGIPEAVWLIHYLKHLARITLKRNSFFVTLGISRLVHNYTTPDAMRIYELVVQDPARVRDDSYYRRRKAQLMQELLDRFGERLSLQRGARGEERFLPMPEPDRYRQLVRDCLCAYTPWETQCAVPAKFDPARDELTSLRFHGKDPDAEHPIEISRIHALLHPECFERLLAALQLDPPARRLDLPRYQGAADGDGNEHRPAARIREEEMKTLIEYLAQQRDRRKRFSPAWLRVVVDGTEIRQSTSSQPERLHFTVSAHAELIEVYGVTEKEEIRLAAYALGYDDADSLLPGEATLALEGGQEVRFDVQPQFNSLSQCSGARVGVVYRDNAPLRSAGEWLREFVPAAFWLRPAAALAVLAIFAALAFWYLKPSPPRVDVVVIPSPTLPASPVPTASVAPSNSPQVADDVIAEDLTALHVDDPANLLTRDKRAAALGLPEARKMYSECFGSARNCASLSQRLESEFNVTQTPEQADIALKASISVLPGGRLSLVVGLVDANGNVIWPLMARTNRRKYEGAPKKVFDRFQADLLGDLRRLRGR